MPEYLAPGVYVEEINAGPRPIAAVSISTTAFVGATVKGPLNEAKVVQSFATYSEVFGPASSASPVSLAVLQFFANGGREAVVVRVTLSGRRRGTLPSPRELIGDAKAETGIHALASQEPFGLLLIPDTSGMRSGDARTVAKAALKFCEKHRVFYIFDVPQGRSKCGSVRAAVDWAQRSKTIRHSSAAVYFPRLSIPDPSGKADSLLVPPSGAVAGLYARTDAERGVWKTPAGRKARLYGVDGAEIDLTDADIELLQHASINPLRSFTGQGIVAWGARTFEPAGARSEWRYVPVRRVALFIEQSLQQGLEWTVFEPNGESLWAQIRLGVSSFMNLLFRAGAFQGAHAREAYMVKCGRETMTQGDIEKGHIVLLVGFAPLKPAEFVVLRFALGAGSLH